jgi:hypothetical protein
MDSNVSPQPPPAVWAFTAKNCVSSPHPAKQWSLQITENVPNPGAEAQGYSWAVPLRQTPSIDPSQICTSILRIWLSICFFSTLNWTSAD